MPKPRGVEAAVGKGLAYLASAQKSDGSFTSWSSARMRPFRRVRDWQTVFVPALMLGSLSGLEDKPALEIRKELAGFLLKEKDDNWSFNYWTKQSPDQKTQPYPNDLDDTFCALAGLYLHDPGLIDEEALAKAVRLLLAAETAVGGPYRTWLVPSDSEPVWLDVDVAVNSNIAYFLSMVSNGLPNLDRLMGETIKLDAFVSPYYPSEYAFIYYCARAYNGPHRSLLLEKTRKLHKKAATDLDRALCISARIRLDDKHGLCAAADKLIAGQGRDGSWAAAAFYADPVKDGKLYYNGGPALTTAFALEALELYRQQHVLATTLRRKDAHSSGKPVLTAAKARCAGLEDDLRGSMTESLKKLIGSSDSEEITRLPHRFNGSLAKPLPDTPGTARLLDGLGLANLFGWLAYTIYDDFLDEEGRPQTLPAANSGMRRSLDCFLEVLPENRVFADLVGRTFDAIDSANAWEQAHCRFPAAGGRLRVGRLPDYGDNLSKLAGRSLGHVLPPMGVLAAKGLDLEGNPARHVSEALKQYLIVRQLNDDVHDWPEDLSRGQITPVVAAVLSELGTNPGSHVLDELMPEARRQFWHATLPKICRKMGNHAKSSRQALASSGLLRTDNVVAVLLEGLEAAISDALAKQGQAEKFLQEYNLGRA